MLKFPVPTIYEYDIYEPTYDIQDAFGEDLELMNLDNVVCTRQIVCDILDTYQHMTAADYRKLITENTQVLKRDEPSPNAALTKLYIDRWGARLDLCDEHGDGLYELAGHVLGGDDRQFREIVVFKYLSLLRESEL